MPRCDDRFARQNRCGPPPEFPLASPCPGIVHHLSGPTVLSANVSVREDPRLVCCTARAAHRSCFRYALCLASRILDSTVDSLVRVSRRAVCCPHRSRVPCRAPHCARTHTGTKDTTSGTQPARTPAHTARSLAHACATQPHSTLHRSPPWTARRVRLPIADTVYSTPRGNYPQRASARPVDCSPHR